MFELINIKHGYNDIAPTLPCLIVADKFHFWTNFTTHFSLLRTTFKKVWPSKVLPHFKDLDRFHQLTPAVRPPPPSLQLGTGEYHLFGIRKVFFTTKLALAHSSQVLLIYTPWKHQKINIKKLKLTSHSIALFVVSGSIKKLFSIIVSIFIFFQYFLNRFCPVEKCGVTSHCLYRD